MSDADQAQARTNNMSFDSDAESQSLKAGQSSSSSSASDASGRSIPEPDYDGARPYGSSSDYASIDEIAPKKTEPSSSSPTKKSSDYADIDQVTPKKAEPPSSSADVEEPIYAVVNKKKAKPDDPTPTSAKPDPDAQTSRPDANKQADDPVRLEDILITEKSKDQIRRTLNLDKLTDEQLSKLGLKREDLPAQPAEGSASDDWIRFAWRPTNELTNDQLIKLGWKKGELAPDYDNAPPKTDLPSQSAAGTADDDWIRFAWRPTNELTNDQLIKLGWKKGELAPDYDNAPPKTDLPSQSAAGTADDDWIRFAWRPTNELTNDQLIKLGWKKGELAPDYDDVPPAEPKPDNDTTSLAPTEPPVDYPDGAGDNAADATKQTPRVRPCPVSTPGTPAPGPCTTPEQ
ncbi:hypothetical protein [Pseudomonas sp. TE3786]